MLRHQRDICGDKYPTTFTCEFCSKNFTRKSNLDRHLANCYAKQEIEIHNNTQKYRRKIKALKNKLSDAENENRRLSEIISGQKGNDRGYAKCP